MSLLSSLSKFSSKLAKTLGVESVSNSSSNYTNTDSTAADGSAEYKGWLLPSATNSGIKGAEIDRTSGFVTSRDATPMVTNIDIPAWGYKNYINERVS